MTEQQKSGNNTDEIDLGQLFRIIGRGFNNLGIGFLRLFLYLKKRAFILGGLIILGVGIGYGLNQIIEKKKKIEVIVKPNVDSENYLYNVIDEIRSNIKANDTGFFSEIGIEVNDLRQFKVFVEPIEIDGSKKGDLEYLQILEKFQNNNQFSELVRLELLKNSTLNHRIVFLFKDSKEGKIFSENVMKYINSSRFFLRLLEISNENAEKRISENELLIKQIDVLIDSYTENLGNEKRQSSDSRILLDTERPMDVTNLLRFKNNLIKDSEEKKIEQQNQQEPINILNFGGVQQVIQPFFGKNLVLLPLILVGMFFVWEGINFLNRKANKILL